VRKTAIIGISVLLAAIGILLAANLIVNGQGPASPAASPMRCCDMRCCESSANAAQEGDAQSGDDQSATQPATSPASEPTEPAFANIKCPIMRQRINPKRVTPDLVADFHGKKVAFCCGGCKPIWNNLSEADKQAKLDAANKDSSSRPASSQSAQ
jgi:hypothetical protein